MGEKKNAEKNKKILWFRAKNYGWGWYPITLEGWVLTIGFILIAYAGATFTATNPTAPFAKIFFPFMLLFTIIFIFICYFTGEKPEWRWSGKPLFKKK